jgi:hypothetical protein
MLLTARMLGARLFPKGVLDVVRQLLLFAGAYYLYRLVRGAVDGRAATSFENARHLISIERSLHVFVEPSVQAWASGKASIIDFASWMYINSHFIITVSALIWLYHFRNGAFYFVRNMFMIAMGLALVGYVVYPTAPPRFFPEWGFSDSVATFTGIDPDSGLASALVNPFAAVPSMHVAFALMIGWPMARLVQHTVFRVAWRLYPFLVTFVVVATGNHFIMDAVLGALTAAVSAYVAHSLLARARPHAWAFRNAEAGAPA